MNCLQRSRLILGRPATSRSLRRAGAGLHVKDQMMPYRYTKCSQHLFTTFRRRKRKKYEKYNSPQLGTVPGGMEDPFAYSGENINEYEEKASLSPWTPVPDSVARRIFDRVEPTDSDIHVELGSGDGRVNFFAIESGVKESIGIDVDESIVKVANERLLKIHPKPNISFIVADLMDPKSPVWKEVSKATILTMYFAKEGLEKILPMVENALRGRKVKVFTCGYEMPGWQAQIVETVLDMPIHFYDWGNEEFEDSILEDSLNVPQDVRTSPDMDKFLKRKNSTFKPDPLKGFHPDDLIDYHWDDFGGGGSEGIGNDKKK